MARTTTTPTNNTDDSETSEGVDPATSAAIERRVAAVRADRIQKAEAKLNVARERLALAQQEAEEAAAAYAVKVGSRERLLAAEEETTVSGALVRHAEQALEKAKVRTTKVEREAAAAIVIHERLRSTFEADLNPDLEVVETAAAQMVGSLGALAKRVAEHRDHGRAMRDARKALNLPEDESLRHSPSVSAIVSLAVLRACRAHGFDPREFSHLVAPHLVT